jgi:hypothetical protein
VDVINEDLLGCMSFSQAPDNRHEVDQAWHAARATLRHLTAKEVHLLLHR